MVGRAAAAGPCHFGPSWSLIAWNLSLDGFKSGRIENICLIMQGAAVLDIETWRRLMAHANPPPRPLLAESFDYAYGSASQPRRVKCADGQYYVLKGRIAGKTMVNEQLVGRLCAAMGAPVGEVTFVEVTQGLIDADPRMAPIDAGVVHGSRFMRDVSNDRQNLAPIEIDINRERFALLAILYGWVVASDHQVLYREQSPKLVFSVDHGHFFPGGPGWTVAQLHAAGTAEPDGDVVSPCGLSRSDLIPAAAALAAVSPESVADAIAWVPPDWPFPDDERVPMALYLDRRRHEMLTGFPEVP